MSREMKFRAWDVINKKMLDWGDIFHLPAWEIFPGTPEQRALNIMEYTGLKDKNGVEIYEGDICKVGSEEWYSNNYFNADEPWSMIMEVVNSEYAYALQELEDKHKEIFLYETNYSDFEIEVIGNCYENQGVKKIKRNYRKTSTTFDIENITFNQTGNNNMFIGRVEKLTID